MADRIKAELNPTELLSRYNELPNVLKKLGFKDLRKGQDLAIASIFGGNDTMVVLPTSLGKTAIYVIPTLVNKWKTIIFSPLIALMQDQLESLLKKKLRAGQLSSAQTPRENDLTLVEWETGNLDFLLVAPERIRNPRFKDATTKVRPDMIAVDECFPGDVEILTEKGFIRFDALQDGIKCAQFNADTKVITFVQPVRLIKNEYKGNLVNLESKYTVSITTTENHEMLVYHETDTYKKVTANNINCNDLWKFQVSSGYTDDILVNTLTDEDKFRLAFQVGGSLYNNTSALFSFTEPRKINRFLDICNKLNLSCNEVKSTKVEEHCFIVNFGALRVSKNLEEVFNIANFSREYARAFIDEVVRWDSTKLRKTRAKTNMLYYTAKEERNTSLVQAVAILAGFRTRMLPQGDKQPTIYRLLINLSTAAVSTQGVVKTITHYEGLVYCVEVPDHNIVVRKNGKVLVVGNCHCCSAWSLNFRSDYCKIGDFIDDVNPRIVLTLTATCPPEVEQDIRRVIRIPDAERVVYLPPRYNLKLFSAPWEGDWNLLKNINSIDGPTLVYCSTVKETQRLFDNLGGQVKGQALVYNGDMKQSERAANQSLFMNDHVRVMFCTNSFGMGIDKANIRGIIHRDIPGTLEAYSQEVGRASRDGIDSMCLLYFDQNSIRIQQFFIQMGYPDKATLISYFNAIQKKADINNVCTSTLFDITKEAGLNPMCSAAVLQIFYGCKVLERGVNEKSIKVKVLQDHIDTKYQDYYTAFERLGIPEENGFYEVDLELLAESVEFSQPTVKKHLAALAENNYISYAPPPKGKPLKIIGDLSNLDFEFLKRREQQAKNKLADMITFYQFPDEMKHNYLTKYFTGTNDN